MKGFSMFKAIKKKIKQNKLNKEIKLDKSKDKLEKFPLTTLSKI